MPPVNVEAPVLPPPEDASSRLETANNQEYPPMPVKAMCAAIGGITLLAASLYVGVRAAHAEGDFTAFEQVTYGVTGDCEEGGRIIHDETEPLSCNAVKPGSVALVNLQGLAPANTNQPAYTPEELNQKANRVEGLLNSLQGADTYEVTTITAPAHVSQKIRRDTESYQRGWECFARDSKHSSLASWVQDEMPSTRSYNYIVTVGADACPELVLNKNGETVLDDKGKPKTKDAAGVAFLNTAPREVDVYTHYSGNTSRDGRLNSNNFDQVVLHEIGHHNKLGHLGNLACGKAQENRGINVYQRFSPESLQKQACQVNEYTSNNNIMGFATDANYNRNNNRGVTDFITKQQMDILRNDTINNSTLALEKGGSTTIARNAAYTGDVSTIRHSLDKPIRLEHDPDSQEYQDYDGILMSAIPGNYKSFKVKLSLTSSTEHGLTIVEADPNFSLTVVKDDYNTVTVGDTTYVFRNYGSELRVMRIATPAN
jgi:hypothetical protein